MKWLFELSDQPVNIEYPITGTQVYDSGAKKGPFYFSLDQFIAALNSRESVAKSLVFENTPTLPNGTIRYAHTADLSTQRVTLELPKSMWDIRYESVDGFFSIGLPRLVVQYDVKQSAQSYYVSDMNIFAVLDNGKPIKEDTLLFRFPYPNVYKENGNVCMGSNERITLSDLTELQHKFVYFIQSPFNEDLGMSTTTGVSNFLKFIELYQEQPFKDEWLLPMSQSHLTFGELTN